MSAEFKELVV